MAQLRQHEDSSAGRCVECQKHPGVGPCAACHGMICGDCGTLTTDPSGPAVICFSCTRMAAATRRRPVERRSSGSRATAWMILAVLGVSLLAVVMRTWLGR